MYSTIRAISLLILMHFSAEGALERVYVGSIDEHSVSLAWGTANGRFTNTIGRQAEGLGVVEIQVGERKFTETKAWIRVNGLLADTEYVYQVRSAGKTLGKGKIRTWPEKSQDLTFFVIGDWGNGSKMQYDLAAAMETERLKQEAAGKRVRFVMSTGDNIYHGGNKDLDWEAKFFVPYAATLSSIPFYAVLGNHDGNESESASDLPTYLDNFFSPKGPMTRWYHFSYGGFAEFFALDSTVNQYPGARTAAYLANGEQSKWLEKSLQAKPLAWRVAYLHHPIFTAGPNHRPAMDDLSHWFKLFQKHGVTSVFAGHEHNLQFSERSKSTGGIQFVVSGAGGELRRSSIRHKMVERKIAAWAPQIHFLVVNIKDEVMSVQPVGFERIQLRNAMGEIVATPILLGR